MSLVLHINCQHLFTGCSFVGKRILHAVFMFDAKLVHMSWPSACRSISQFLEFCHVTEASVDLNAADNRAYDSLNDFVIPFQCF